jgi:hypothetical protein
MGTVRRPSKKVKSASGDSSSTSPERNRRDDIAIDIEIERGGSGAGLSCGSTGGLGGTDGTDNAISNVPQMYQISVRDHRAERHQISQDHWHHKSSSPVSTAHASLVGGGAQAVNKIYAGAGRYRFNEVPKSVDSRPKKNVAPSPILKYLKVKVGIFFKHIIFNVLIQLMRK